MINIEGKGFSGSRNMSANSVPFGSLAILSIQLDPTARAIHLQVDGKDAGSRPWDSKEISIDQWTLGARFYTNGPTEQQVRGNLACDIAELIVFDGGISVGDPCEARAYHGFNGIEREVIARIAAWIAP
jgi:hypothetical protein